MTVTAPLTVPKHPARFSFVILARLTELVPPGSRVCDPFAGTGRVHSLAGNNGIMTVGVEIEPEWAAMDWRTVVGDATALPFPDDVFDVVATSPCYGNRLADHHEAKDGSVRHSYTHDLGRRLHPNNAGQLHWGEAYRDLHDRAWRESVRVLRPGGRFLLNISDHVRKGAVQPVTAWHVETLKGLGLVVVDHWELSTPRLRFGANANTRVDCESVVVLEDRS